VSTWTQHLHRWDERTTHALHVPRGHSLYPLVVLGAHLGDGPLWLALWAAGWMFWRDDPWLARGILAWVGSAVVATAVTYTIKFTVKRRRPRRIRGFYSHSYDAHAFPSGHATRMGNVAVWGSVLFPVVAPLFWLVSLWCVVSRVALGVHYVADVIAGFLIGAIVSLVAIAILL